MCFNEAGATTATVIPAVPAGTSRYPDRVTVRLPVSSVYRPIVEIPDRALRRVRDDVIGTGRSAPDQTADEGTPLEQDWALQLGRD